MWRILQKLAARAKLSYSLVSAQTPHHHASEACVRTHTHALLSEACIFFYWWSNAAWRVCRHRFVLLQVQTHAATCSTMLGGGGIGKGVGGRRVFGRLQSAIGLNIGRDKMYKCLQNFLKRTFSFLEISTLDFDSLSNVSNDLDRQSVGSSCPKLWFSFTQGELDYSFSHGKLLSKCQNQSCVSECDFIVSL